jgi:hypothetical protein
MCVEKVKKIGVHTLQLSPRAFWTNSCHDRLLECQLTDFRPASSRRVDMGPRYVCASQSAWASIEAHAAAFARPDDKAFAVITAGFIKSDLTNATPDGFRLVPPISDKYRAPRLPSECAPWNQVPDLGAGSCPHYLVSVSNKSFTLLVCETQIAAADAQRTDAWHRPAQILLVPAVLVDIVTSPIQLIMILHELSKIDG